MVGRQCTQDAEIYPQDQVWTDPCSWEDNVTDGETHLGDPDQVWSEDTAVQHDHKFDLDHADADQDVPDTWWIDSTADQDLQWGLVAQTDVWEEPSDADQVLAAEWSEDSSTWVSKSHAWGWEDPSLGEDKKPIRSPKDEHNQRFCLELEKSYNMNCDKAPFNLEEREPVSDVPSQILKRCFGKQTPVVPHSQRLLTAAAKDAKAEGKGKGTGKGKSDKPKAKKPSKPKSKTSKKKTEKKTPAEPKKKTPYAEAKDAFIDKFRVRINLENPNQIGPSH
eukprot:s436_g47.t1